MGSVTCGRFLLTVCSRNPPSNRKGHSMAKLTPAGGPPNAGEITYRGDLPAPVTTYASAQANLPMRTRLTVPAGTNRTGAPVVNRVPRRNGLRYFYSHGGIRMPFGGVPRPGAGGVTSSAFQQILVQLHDWVTNRNWYEGGYPQNLGLSFRAQQLVTKATGGPTSAAMETKPVFAKVQTVRRYSVTPPRYPTRSARG
jgi:hypothetical protein